MDNVGGRLTVTREFGRARGAAARHPPGDDAVVHVCQRVGGLRRSPDEALADLTLPRRADRDGHRPDAPAPGRGQRSSISLDGGRNTTNNLLDAKRGYLAAVHLEHAGTYLGGDYKYYELNGELRYYLSIGEPCGDRGRGRAAARSTASARRRRI